MSYAPTVSVIVPTIGRPSLHELLVKDLLPQLGDGDEVLVVGDGEQPRARAIASGIDPRIKYHEYGPTRLWGHPQRNWAMLRVQGTHIYSCDDDDLILPGALERMRQAALEGPDRLHIFRVHHEKSVLPTKQAIELTVVSTQCFFFANIPDRFGTWGKVYEGDLHFIQSAVRAHPEGERALMWRDEIIAVHGIGGTRPCPPGNPDA